MKDYRAFLLGQGGHVFGAEGFEASNDDDALRKAQFLVDGCDVEVWQLARKSARSGPRQTCQRPMKSERRFIAHLIAHRASAASC
ncbi:hypothetical protein XH83_27520 [Bradyrhizobium sp. CCBAU 53351]|nr:hypothetical protein XH83_27520 [Bradyrhizobium sp. CCBAU 53351]